MSPAHAVRWVKQYGFILSPLAPAIKVCRWHGGRRKRSRQIWNFVGSRLSPSGPSSPGRSSTAKALSSPQARIGPRPKLQNRHPVASHPSFALKPLPDLAASSNHCTRSISEEHLAQRRKAAKDLWKVLFFAPWRLCARSISTQQWQVMLQN